MNRKRVTTYDDARRRYLRELKKEMAMSTSNEPDLPGRIIGASLITVLVAYGAFLILDIINGWGLGFVILGWAGAVLAAIVLLGILVFAWVWVYEATGHYQHKRKAQS